MSYMNKKNRNPLNLIIFILLFIQIEFVISKTNSILEELLSSQNVEYGLDDYNQIYIKDKENNCDITQCIEFRAKKQCNLSIYLENVKLKMVDKSCFNFFLNTEVVNSLTINYVTMINVDIDSYLINFDMLHCKDCIVQQVNLINVSSTYPLFKFNRLLNLIVDNFKSDIQSICSAQSSIIKINKFELQSKLQVINIEIPSLNLTQNEIQLSSPLPNSQNKDLLKSCNQTEKIISQKYENRQLSLILITQDTESKNSLQNLYFENIKIDFNKNNIRFLTITNLEGVKVYIQNSIFLRNKAISDGGSIQIDGASTLYLNNTIFDSCESERFGGAIKVQQIIVNNSTFQNCRSKIGGAIFSGGKSHEQNQSINFINNTAAISSPDIFYCTMLSDDTRCRVFKFDQIFEYHQQLRETPLSFVESNFEYKKGLQSELIYGVYYILKFRVQFEYQNFKQTNFSNEQQMGNLYEYLSPQTKQYYFPQSIQNITYPYLVTTYSPDLDCSSRKPHYLYDFQYFSYYISDMEEPGCFNATIECKQGMELKDIFTSQEKYKICSQCGLGFVSYNFSQSCSLCNPQLYNHCYSNISSIKQGWWRSKFSIDDSNIYQCSLNPSNCNGDRNKREGIGNSLCSQGYIGEQCLKCDNKGIMWNDTYGQVGSFQCVKCESLKNNKLYFILSMFFQVLLLIFALYSNFMRMKKQVLRKYLSIMKIVYIGTSFNKQSQTSIYIKILLFNFQMYLSAYYFVDFNEQDNSTHSSFFTFFNPFQSQGSTSFDCFLNDIFPNSESIGYLKLLIAVFLPLFINGIIFICVLIIAFLKQLRKVQLLYLMLHCFSYTTIFVFQSSILQYSIEALKCLSLTKEGKYLVLDTSINCSDTQWMSRINLLSIPSIIFYIILVPLGLFISLYLQRKNLNKSRVTCFLGFLYTEYKKQFYYWQFLKIFLAISMTSLFQLFRTQIILGVLLYCSILTVYAISVVIFMPFISINLNRIEVCSIVLSILYLLSSLSLQLCYSPQYKLVDIHNSNRFIINFFYYLVIVCLAILYVYMTILIISSFFYISIQKCQTFRLFSYVSSRFPYIVSKLYSKQLRDNFKLLREKVKQISILRKLDIPYVRHEDENAKFLNDSNDQIRSLEDTENTVQ